MTFEFFFLLFSESLHVHIIIFAFLLNICHDRSSVSSANHRAMYISGHCTSKFSVFKEGLLLINVIISSNAFIACLWRKKLLTRPKLKNGKLSTKNKWRSTIRNRWKNCIFVSFETAICLTCCCLTFFYFTIHRKVLLKMAWRVMKRMRRWMAKR